MMNDERVMLIRRCFLLTLLLGLTGFGVAQAQPPTAQGVLFAYYSTINRKDYRAAYSLWLHPPQRYPAFASGFSATDHIEPYFGALQSAAVPGELGSVPALLLTYMTDGTIVSSFGCFKLTSMYQIVGATIRAISSSGIPDGASISRYLALDCANLPTSIPTTFTDSSSPAFAMIARYFRLINLRAYAYPLWLNPLPDGQPFNLFAARYNATRYVNVYPGVYHEIGGSAVQPYVDGLLPVVLVSLANDGAVTTAFGCFVIGKFGNGQYGIVNTTLAAFDGIPTGDQIVDEQNIDCTPLGLQD